MSSFEYEGKNVDKAVQNACKRLNLNPDELNYEVLSYGSSGIFGLAGAKKARILVNLPENQNGLETTDDLPELEPVYLSGAETSVTSAVDVSGYEHDPSALTDNPVEAGRAALERIVDAITSDAEIRVEKDSERVLLKVTGGNAALLIGKKGQTLEAIQTIIDKIVNKQNNHNQNGKVRVQIDVEGYLENRKTNLEQLALRLADKSQRIRKPISLGQMSAYDRRIVHLALKDISGVRTKSRGEGYMRKLVIFPQKNNPERVS
jgi:spoIIIJ-associated protein